MASFTCLTAGEFPDTAAKNCIIFLEASVFPAPDSPLQKSVKDSKIDFDFLNWL